MSARRRSSQRSQSRRGRVQRTSRPQQLERNPLKPTLQRTLGHTRGFYRPLMWRATPGSAYSTPCRSRRSTVAVRRAAPGVRPGGSRRLAQHLWGRQRCSRQPRCRGPPRGASDAYPIRSGRPLRGCDQRPCLLGYMPVAGLGQCSGMTPEDGCYSLRGDRPMLLGSPSRWVARRRWKAMPA
jgi:hypothetical protein